ncbi:MAG: hypothetical protein ABIR62_07405 [Dokdonella sp.]|uniref:tetratricopeptide repeat protein n=1 Tax=Dokdonella sp. TaxID=2291710 RepID=UPI003266EA57
MFRATPFFVVAATLLAASACAPAAHAAEMIGACTIPQPISSFERLYLGADRDAHATRFDPANEQAFLDLDRRLRANPDDVDARITRGYALARRGERTLSAADYRRATKLAPHRTRIGWSEGWALWALGDPTCALNAWQRAGSLQGGDAFWLPYTLAMGYWAAGKKDVAIAYYHAAARSAPERFGTLEAMNTYTQRWAPDERRTMNDIASAAGVQPSSRFQPPNWLPWTR